jgi:hypothetical protein
LCLGLLRLRWLVGFIRVFSLFRHEESIQHEPRRFESPRLVD